MGSMYILSNGISVDIDSNLSLNDDALVTHNARQLKSQALWKNFISTATDLFGLSLEREVYALSN